MQGFILPALEGLGAETTVEGLLGSIWFISDSWDRNLAVRTHAAADGGAYALCEQTT
jgi:hypothetical protein